MPYSTPSPPSTTASTTARGLYCPSVPPNALAPRRCRPRPPACRLPPAVAGVLPLPRRWMDGRAPDS